MSTRPTSLSPGTRLGYYEIVEPLGAGGMGEVYRAHDSRLERDVAIKVLPEVWNDRPDALLRFQREAKAVAALSHPNILSIFDFGNQDGLIFAVMELLDGETLRSRLYAGPLPVRKAIEYGVQIAAGLGAAHEKGIVHRDLKPENIFIIGDGRIKILDFGLALQTVPVLEADDVSSATTTAGTDPGHVMGTTSYMSPEQIRGRMVDPRSDIFAFGVVLYEMLTGRRPFPGQTPAETMAAILKDDPQPITESNPSVPAALERLVIHCLEKSPGERFRSAQDLAFALEAVAGGSSRTSQLPVAIVASVAWRRGARWGALGLAALVAGFFLGRWGREAREPHWHAAFTQLTLQSGVEKFPSISPDGSSFVYVSSAAGNEDLYLQRVYGRNAINLTGDSHADNSQPAFSPDGSTIAFRSERGGGGIFLMGATGENVRRLTNAGYNPSWSPDGAEIVYATESIETPWGRSGRSQLWVVKIATGERHKLTEGDAVQPSWSSHGHRIAYWTAPSGTGLRNVYTMPSAGGVPVAITNDTATNWNPVWSPDGRYLYFGSDRAGPMSLWRVEVDEMTGKPTGAPEPMTTPSHWSGHFSISRDGRQIVYQSADDSSSIERTAFDPQREELTGQPRPVVTGSLLVDAIDVSPDGQWLAFSTSHMREDIFVVRTDGTGLRQLTNDPFRDRVPRWSPDGGRLAFYSNRGGLFDVWVIPTDGSAPTQLFGASRERRAYSPNWSPDGSQVVVSSVENLDIYPSASGAQPKAVPPPAGERLTFNVTAWSPDGNLLAGSNWQADGTLVPGAVLYSLQSGTYQRINDRGIPAAWFGDSGRLLCHEDGKLFVLDVRSKASRPVAGSSQRISSRSFLVDSSHAQVTLSRDNRQIYYVTRSTESDVWEMTLTEDR